MSALILWDLLYAICIPATYQEFKLKVWIFSWLLNFDFDVLLTCDSSMILEKLKVYETSALI